MKEIRIGIIGTGIIAHQHAEKYNSIPGVKIVAACDILEKKLNSFCDKHGIQHRYVDYRELLKRDDLDAIDVCLHNNLHMPMTVKVLDAGFHCYCEKPMAGTYADAAMMAQRAEETGKKLNIQLATLYTQQIHCAKQIIDDGHLGKVYHGRSYGYRRRGRPFVDGYGEKEFVSAYWAAGGALYDMGVYHISSMLYLMDVPKLKSVSGQIYQELDMNEQRRKESGFNVEELGCGFVKFDGGVTMDIFESWAINAGEFPPSMIAGSKGGLSVRPSHHEPNEALMYYTEMSGYPTAATIDVRAERYRMRKIDPAIEVYDNQQTEWIAALRGDCPWPKTVNIALNTMLISEGIFMSSKLGREVTHDEIVSNSRSLALTTQETPFGVLNYVE